MDARPSLSTPELQANGLVTYASGRGLAQITLCNPPANGYSHEMMLDLDQAILRARFDDEVAVIVLAGEGEKFFCAGADIGMLGEVTPSFKYAFCLHANETLLRLEHTPKLVIAALGGHCVGGGLEVALAADLRVARKGSGKCGLPEAKLGVLPGTGGTQRLARLLGSSRAIGLMAEGNTFDYDEAEELGLINHQVEAEDEAGFMEAVLDWARTFTPPEAASGAIGLIKRAVQSGADLPLESGLALERELQARLFMGRDASEGIDAFKGKRPPHFTGQ
ncbi:enoyl-CoA hydratase [Candidatus Woesearchaeota archaeon]|jgi:enoyl-CoA hydratase/carnithine racemase|nr:enoyl-CoA hydratase [Candidatus Woesearchaeota archaeon]MDP6739210.1 enoyl-CoA hydratase/isomerase family protein [Planctomycetota bacterium]MDP6939011.1 enoyl-CoA hydratase/isomerase family protein [Planctomycetota bacterium]